jgi:predicted Rossmann-fold nucleotide-binding protein
MAPAGLTPEAQRARIARRIGPGTVEQNASMIVVGIFGGTANADVETAAMARRLGADVSAVAPCLVLTGGDNPRGKGAKNEALAAPDGRLDRGWIGVTRDGRVDVRTPRPGLVLDTDLGHRRNYLEACLVDGALALPGEEGTISEATATLCLGKPVVFVGDFWLESSPLAPVLNEAGAGRSIAATAWTVWITAAMTRLGGDPRSPIGRLIELDVRAERLAGAEARLRHVPSAGVASAAATVLGLIGSAPTHAFPPLGDRFDVPRRAFDEFVAARR